MTNGVLSDCILGNNGPTFAPEMGSVWAGNTTPTDSIVLTLAL
jgi:hypothetical protein